MRRQRHHGGREEDAAHDRAFDRLGEGLALAHAPRRPLDVEHDSAVHETVQDRRGDNGISEHLAPRKPRTRLLMMTIVVVKRVHAESASVRRRRTGPFRST